MKDATKIFKRHEGGPLLHVKDFPGKAQIYNPAPVQCGDETILLVSVVEHAATKGFGRDVGQTRVARSKDGINFELSIDVLRDHSKITVLEQDLGLQDFLDADEVWLSSSTRELAPVTQIDERVIGNGEIGPMWASVIDLFHRHKYEYA